MAKAAITVFSWPDFLAILLAYLRKYLAVLGLRILFAKKMQNEKLCVVERKMQAC